MPSKVWERLRRVFALTPYPFLSKAGTVGLETTVAGRLRSPSRRSQIWNLDNGTKVLMGPVRLANYAPITLLLAQSRALLPT
jgi:hypothetical protein